MKTSSTSGIKRTPAQDVRQEPQLYAGAAAPRHIQTPPEQAPRPASQYKGYGAPQPQQRPGTYAPQQYTGKARILPPEQRQTTQRLPYRQPAPARPAEPPQVYRAPQQRPYQRQTPVSAPQPAQIYRAQQPVQQRPYQQQTPVRTQQPTPIDRAPQPMRQRPYQQQAPSRASQPYRQQTAYPAQPQAAAGQAMRPRQTASGRAGQMYARQAAQGGVAVAERPLRGQTPQRIARSAPASRQAANVPPPRSAAAAQAAIHQRSPAPPRQTAAARGGSGARARTTGKGAGRAVPMLLILVDLMLLALWLWRFAPWSVQDVTLEIGSPMPDVQDFVANELFGVQLVRGLDSSIDMDTVGDHEIVFRIFGFERQVWLHVVDTVPPAVMGRDIEAYQNGSVTPEQFLETVEDKSPTTAAFLKEPNLSVLGLQQVRIRVTDAGGNRTDITANMNVLPDTEAPVISGVQELTVEQGGSVSYKRDVTVTDNCDTEVELQVDNSAVDLNTPGTYPVVYRATDRAGNTAEVSTVLYVITPLAEDISETVVQDAAASILEELFPNGLVTYSQRDIIYAIYRYCHDNIWYVDYSNKDNWIEACYRGLVEHKGDCYVYAMSAKLLLTRAGIQNRDIAKIPHGDSLHFWNLVNIGEGWYHFDTTRRADDSEFFYLTDVELMQYSNAHNYSHAYDPGIYTDIVGQAEAVHRYPAGVQPSGVTELPAA